MYELSAKDFNLFRKLIFDKSGISLHDGKLGLVQTRLAKRLRRLNIVSFKDYYRLVSANSDEPEMLNMLDAITTNQTSFFREQKHFDFLNKTGLPHILEGKEKTGDTVLRIWSAGCSSGEEPYSLAITTLEFLNNYPQYEVKIVATDLSTQVLNAAARGIYEKNKLKDVPNVILRKYFRKGDNKWKGFFRVKPEVSKITQFKRLNLMENHFPFSSPFDIIFCRNVMIYFDKKTQEQLINKYYSVLKPGNYFFIGHSESLMGVKHNFKYVLPTIYMK